MHPETMNASGHDFEELYHGLQPTRLLCPWDFPGKSTGVAIAFSAWEAQYLPKGYGEMARAIMRTDKTNKTG